MDLNMRVDSFVQLGNIFSYLGASKTWDGYHLGVNEAEYIELESAIQKAKIYNGWFDEGNVRLAFKNLSIMLHEDGLNDWVNSYKVKDELNQKTIALIMAGNVPMVGFHDLLCVLISGNKALIKLSSDDNVLLPKVIDVLCTLQPEFNSHVEIASGKLENFDAVIATGSNNSARYFESYFGKYPSIIRKNRTSVAILNGTESEEDLEKLADDVFMFYGLGCRNVSKLYLPENFDKDRLFKAFFKYKHVIDNKKYANNYDYNKAIYLMNKIPILENGFLILKEDKGLNSPLSVLFFESYSSKSDVENQIGLNKNKIQCVVSEGDVRYGESQKPLLDSYADNIDTLNFIYQI